METSRSSLRGLCLYILLLMTQDLGDIDVMRLLLGSGADGDAVDQRGKTPVHWAAQQGRIEALMLLEKQGCNLWARVNGRGTALHYAADYGDLSVVEWLVEHGVDMACKDKNKWLAKDVAKRNGHKHVHQYLKSLAEKQPKRSSSRSRKLGLGDPVASPSPQPRRDTHDAKTEKPRGGAADDEKDKGSEPLAATTNINKNVTIRKMKWSTIRSRTTGAKAGMRLQLEELKRELEDQKELLRAKDDQISSLQRKTFSAELEKLKSEDQLRELRTEIEQRGRPRLRHGLTTDVSTSREGSSSSVGSSGVVLNKERLNYDHFVTTARLGEKMQEKNNEEEIRRELEAKLEAEKRERAKEQEASDLRIASLTAELEEALEKLRKYGIRQRKLLSKNRSFGVDLAAAGAPSGLPKLGNTNYMNPIIQCLFSVANLRDYFISDAYRRDIVSGSEAASAVAGVFKALRSGVQREILTKLQCLGEVAGSLDGHFGGGHVSDAHDLLTCLLTWLHHDLCQADGTSMVSQLFFGMQVNNVRCHWTAADISHEAEDFSSISMEVTEEEQTLQSLQAGHYKPQNVEHHCPHCERIHICLRTTTLTHLPPLLFIHLIRNNSQNNKIKVNFPAHQFFLQDALASNRSSWYTRP